MIRNSAFHLYLHLKIIIVLLIDLTYSGAMVICILGERIKFSGFNKSFLFFIVLISIGCSAKETLYYSAPTRMPRTIDSMKTPGFWISKHGNPDEIAMNSRKIENFNNITSSKLKLINNIKDHPAIINGFEIRKEIMDFYFSYAFNRYFLENGKKTDPLFFDKIKNNLNLDGIPETIIPQFGYITGFTDQRQLPTDKRIYRSAFDINFDRVQNSAYDIGTPIIILHASFDGKWLYTKTSYSSGWIKKKDVGLCPKDKLYRMYEKNFVVITSAKADIYTDLDMKTFYSSVRMGSKFPLLMEHNTYYEIELSVRKKNGYVETKSSFLSRNDAHRGYLSYTARNAITQAFKLLNTPYGWGGMFAEQDCSKFIQEIFGTMGIALPRNSTSQAKVGHLVKEFKIYKNNSDKYSAIREYAIPGITILRMPGHIMLYLGEYNEKLYTIHDFWSYKEKTLNGIVERVVNKVAVTDMLLGEDTESGSLIEGIDTVRIIQ